MALGSLFCSAASSLKRSTAAFNGSARCYHPAHTSQSKDIPHFTWDTALQRLGKSRTSSLSHHPCNSGSTLQCMA